MAKAPRAPHPAARLTNALTATMAFLTMVAPHAAAQTVWRCGADGNSYSERPCEDTGRTVDVRNPRNTNELAQAHAEARQWQAAAQRMATDREARDRANPPLGPTALNAPRNDSARTATRAGRRDNTENQANERRNARRKKVHGLDPAQGFIAFAPGDEASVGARGRSPTGSKPR